MMVLFAFFCIHMLWFSRDILTHLTQKGIALPLFTISLFLYKFPVGKAFETWLWATWAYEMGLAIVFGILVGLSSRVALKYSEQHNWIDKKNFFSFEIALAVIILALYVSFAHLDVQHTALCDGILHNLPHLFLYCSLCYRGGICLGRVVCHGNRGSPRSRSH
jgi:hypothetical protein